MPSGYDPKAAVLASRRCLPHLRQANTIYYVTFRLADSLPAVKLTFWQDELSRLLSEHPEMPAEERSLYVPRKIEQWLDGGHGQCILKDSELAGMVLDTMAFFDNQRYLLDEFVIMPNHVHALVMPMEGQELALIVRAWKSVSAHQINRRLGRHGAVWQHESFDHIVRDEQALLRFRRYIRSNPAKLPLGHYLLGQGQFEVGDRKSP